MEKERLVTDILREEKEKIKTWRAVAFISIGIAIICLYMLLF